MFLSVILRKGQSGFPKQKQIYQKLIHYSKISRICNRMVNYFNQTTTYKAAYLSNCH